MMPIVSRRESAEQFRAIRKLITWLAAKERRRRM
jgi:hypothetical protein